MALVDIKRELDTLFAAPPGQFVAYRNALAKRLKAAGLNDLAVEVRGYSRPTPTAWAVNTIKLKSPEILDTLADAGAALRHAQQSSPGDLRAASDAHRRAVQDLVERATAVLVEAGSPPNALATRRLRETAEALAGGAPAGEAGRLTRDLEPPGFDAFELAQMVGVTKEARGGAGPAPRSRRSHSLASVVGRKRRPSLSEITDDGAAAARPGSKAKPPAAPSAVEDAPERPAPEVTSTQLSSPELDDGELDHVAADHDAQRSDSGVNATGDADEGDDVEEEADVVDEVDAADDLDDEEGDDAAAAGAEEEVESADAADDRDPPVVSNSTERSRGSSRVPPTDPAHAEDLEDARERYSILAEALSSAEDAHRACELALEEAEALVDGLRMRLERAQATLDDKRAAAEKARSKRDRVKRQADRAEAEVRVLEGK